MRLWLVAALAAVWMIAAGSSSAQIPKVDGYGGYKFGMTLEQAKNVNPAARKTACDFKNVAFCLEYETSISALPALISVQFIGDDPRIRQIIVTFDSIKEPVKVPCADTAKEVLKLLAAKYGLHPFIEGRNFTWSSPEGGSVALASFCVDDRKGVNVVSYQNTGSL